MNDIWKNQLYIKLDVSNPLRVEYIPSPRENIHLEYMHNKLYGPAVIYDNGVKKWYKGNKIYTIISYTSYKALRVNGKLIKICKYE